MFSSGNNITHPLLHSDFYLGWAIPTYPPSPLHVLASLGGFRGWPFLIARWLALVCLLVALVLGYLIKSPSIATPSSGLIGDALAAVCTGPVNAAAYVDPVSGFTTVVLVAIAFKAVLAAIHSVQSHQKRLFGCLEKVLPKRVVEFLRAQVAAETDKASNSLDTGFKAASHRTQRSLFLFIHTMAMGFVIGYCLRTGPSGGAVCRAANVISIVFQKPFISSLIYSMAFFMDQQGWLLWHNPLTDSLVAALMTLAGLWFIFAFVFSGPLLLFCFPYLAIIFFLPPIAFIFLVGPKECVESEKYMKGRGWSDAKINEALAAQVIFKRLVFYSVFCCLVFGLALFPLYEGRGYSHVLRGAAGHLSLGLRFWSPRFRLSFSWPHIALPAQVLALGFFKLLFVV